MAKLISDLSAKGGKMPERWSPSDLVQLVDSYARLIEISGKQGSSDIRFVNQVMQKGQVGAYEAMEQRARNLERQNLKGKKNK